MKAAKITILIMAFALTSIYMAGCHKHAKHCKDNISVLKEEAVTSTVNIPNSNGSTTPVLIRRQGNVWIGPKGEQYTSYPTVEQLKPVYGF